MRRSRRWAAPAAVSAGGALGALARHAIATGWPTPPAAFPWPTFVINISGCLLIGALTVSVAARRPHDRLVRPFLGAGVLGGYTTFSAYAVEGDRLLAGGATGVALLYVGGTLVAALLAVAAGGALAGRVLRAAAGSR